MGAVFLGDWLIKFGDAGDCLAKIEGADARALGAGLGARNQQQRVEDGDQPVRFLNRALQRGAIGDRI